MRVAVVRFPGSNCDWDSLHSARRAGHESYFVWHRDTDLQNPDVVVLPGGFSYGDYLRSGAIARFSPIMSAVAKFAADGGPVVGICNGFQVLTEAGLLPGALQKNRGLKFLCTTVELRVESTRSALTSAATAGSVLRVPINHFEGNYTCSPETLRQLHEEDRVVSTRTRVAVQRNLSPRFFCSAPGSSPASVSTWKPLQIPITGPPAAACSRTPSMTGEKRAMAPGRR